MTKEELIKEGEFIQIEYEKYNADIIKNALEKLNLIEIDKTELPFEINKLEVYKDVKESLLMLKTVLYEFKQCNIELNNPLEHLNEIKAYSLLIDYLEKDKTVDTENVKVRTR